MTRLGYRVALALAVVLFVAYCFAGDGWRALGLFAVLLLLVALRRDLTRRSP